MTVLPQWFASADASSVLSLKGQFRYQSMNSSRMISKRKCAKFFIDRFQNLQDVTLVGRSTISPLVPKGIYKNLRKRILHILKLLPHNRVLRISRVNWTYSFGISASCISLLESNYFRYRECILKLNARAISTFLNIII